MGCSVSDIELIEFEEENEYKWLQANLDRNGNINFSGISPSLDVTVPSILEYTVQPTLSLLK